jgi:hypothetical protein
MMIVFKESFINTAVYQQRRNNRELQEQAWFVPNERI